MYVSQYYTCEEIDERLLQGYYNDFVAAGFTGSKQDFLDFVLSISDKADVKNMEEMISNLESELKKWAEELPISTFENDSKYVTETNLEDTVEDLIMKITGNAPELLDTLKELADALGDDPEFAAHMTQYLNQIKEAIETEIDRAKEQEEALQKAIDALETTYQTDFSELKSEVEKSMADFQSALDTFETNINSTVQSLQDGISTFEDDVNDRIEKLRQLFETEVQQLESVYDNKISAIQSTVDTFTTLVENSQAQIQQNTQNIQNNLDLIQKLTSRVSDLETTSTELKNSLDTLQKALDEEIARAQEAETNLQNSLNTETEERKANEEEINSNLLKAAQILSAQIKDVDDISNLAGIFEEIGEGYLTLEEVATTLKNFLVNADATKETIDTWKEIEDFLKGITDKDTLEGLLNDLKTEVEKELTEAQETLQTNIDKVASDLKDSVSNLEEEIETTKSDLEDEISSTKSDLETAIETAKTEAEAYTDSKVEEAISSIVVLSVEEVDEIFNEIFA